MKIEKVPGIFIVDVKRLYLPFKVTMPCPECGHEWVWSKPTGHYVAYPQLGQPKDLYGYCEECDHEWEVWVTLEITMTPAAAPKEEE